ncbi:MAG: TIGR03960 family B12-binding radical SAM protein [Clostridiales bacterium]|nr:TIGR03960 family B12-binding radical SAM protein [Clostridiales bacterium]
MTINLDDIKDLLLKSEKPARYTGGEFGMPELKENSACNFCLCFPDLYEVGMSNLGIKIVAESISRRGYFADFCFTPWKDFGDGLKERGVPLYSLGLKKPLAEFDILGFSLQFELCYTNVLYMLDLAGIPLLRKDRVGKKYPLIAFGGPCAVNPEPLAEIADIVFIGDGESTDAEVCDLYAKYGSSQEFFERASKIEGVYIPAFTQVKYAKDGHICGFEGITRVKKAIAFDLENAPFPKTFAVANIESVHDRAVIEVMRGCYRGCRFCQAGFIYRPVRKKSVKTLTEQACNLIKNTGFDEVSMNSLSTGDYKHLRELIKSLRGSLPKEVTLALPSLRVDSFDGEIAQDARRISLTFAPEAGSQRLRDVINKDITEDEIIKAAESAFDVGYSAVKLYFMMGLPTETDEDLKAMSRIVGLIKGAYAKQKRGKPLRISLSVSTFIPKPFTPFQWERQCSLQEAEQKQEVLKKHLFIKGVSLSWSDYFTAKLEAVLARGDRRLNKVIISAYQKGCKFDGWTKELNKKAWQEAFDECGIDMDYYTREWGEDEILPWDLIDISVSKKFLLNERHKAYSGDVTGSCQTGCKGCGMQANCPAAKGDL